MIRVSGSVPIGDAPVDDALHIAPGARWWRVDIHGHSPASKDYGGREGQDSDSGKPSFRVWLQGYIDAGIDGLVITDHNTYEGVEQARTALRELRQENEDLRDIVIFPGVELTVSGGVHILGIFDPATPAQTIGDVIARCNYGGIPGGSTQTANATVVDAANEIAKAGGICVPAHADKTAGILTRSELDLPAIRQSAITAVEIVDDANVPTADRQGWVALLGSDAHFLTTEGCPPGQEAKAPGTHFTWIKAERLDLEGVKLALTDAKESVLRSRGGSVDLNATSHGHIDQITVSHKGAVETFRFNPWMNCLIGGRGVGKSTVLELIRLAMGRSGDLRETALMVELERFIPGGDRAQLWWDESSAMEVRYTKDTRLLRILWSGSMPTDSRVQAWNGSEWEPQAGQASDRAPVQIFSQKQIYELARQPQSFLAILDRMEEVRKAEWSEQYSALESQFRQAREQLRELLTQTDRAERLRGRLQEVQGRLRHLAELRADSRYQELEETESNLRLVALAETEAGDATEQLRQQATALRSIADSHRDVPDYQVRTGTFAEAATLIDDVVAKLEASALNWQGGGTQDGWTTRIQALGVWLAEQGGQTQNLSPEQTNADRQLEKTLQEELLEFERTDEKVGAKINEINEMLERLVEKRKELHQRRSDYVSALSSDTDTPTRVRVYHQGGIAGVGDELRAVLNRPDSFDAAFERDGIANSLFEAEPKSPTFAQTTVPTFKKELLDLVQRGADSDVARRVRIDARFHRRSESTDQFDLETNVLLWFPEDLVSVEYKPTTGSNYTAVDQGSPGQKTAALLAIVLQMGNEPLLLDQPEDDLENKLIKHLAVETLKRIKRNRQLIISTHNANIVVTSAAEQVLVIQHGDDLPSLEASGTLQAKGVRDNVCLILEGGVDAITTRYKRLVG